MTKMSYMRVFYLVATPVLLFAIIASYLANWNFREELTLAFFIVQFIYWGGKVMVDQMTSAP